MLFQGLRFRPKRKDQFLPFLCRHKPSSRKRCCPPPKSLRIGKVSKVFFCKRKNMEVDFATLYNLLRLLTNNNQQQGQSNNPFDASQVLNSPPPPTPQPITPENRREENAPRQNDFSSSSSSQPPSVISLKNRRNLMMLGLVLLHLHEKKNLPTRIAENIEYSWESYNHTMSFEAFREKSLNNLSSILSEDDNSLELFTEMTTI
ncbi:hypothetical protein GMAR_ORF98 [Golden Marseillevirus]|uniref:hypothetical protein n=1 Tax=Golden Marseillevirus TaxID=1720526 RepID=UPI000877ABDC|nr:hypothetical protein GMAR_ORF98 [Golden Marseillevirus]ALX27472.1 hypothetical protein GMAR_ORF98 [Golden Marseillevirus]